MSTAAHLESRQYCLQGCHLVLLPQQRLAVGLVISTERSSSSMAAAAAVNNNILEELPTG
jgi:hypothetical protein